MDPAKASRDLLVIGRRLRQTDDPHSGGRAHTTDQLPGLVFKLFGNKPRFDVGDFLGLFSVGTGAPNYWMPQMGGPAASAAIKSRAPNSRVVLLSWLYGRHELQNALAAGATAFIPKSFRIAALVDTIRKVHSGEAPVYPPELERLLASNKDRAKGEAVWSKLASLTDREGHKS